MLLFVKRWRLGDRCGELQIIHQPTNSLIKIQFITRMFRHQDAILCEIQNKGMQTKQTDQDLHYPNSNVYNVKILKCIKRR